jgi:hypothetical protein
MNGFPRPVRRALPLLAFLLPVAVAAGIYAFGRTYSPNYANALFGVHGTDTPVLKARLGTALLGMALVQLVLGLWAYGRLPGARRVPRHVPAAHRAVGWLAFLLSLPIAYHCLTTYGFQRTSTRVALHSITGCLLYGAFTAKVLLVRTHRLPGWTLPLAGAALLTAIALLWYTAALWVLNGYSVPGL